MKHKHRWQCIDCGAVKCAAVKPVKNKHGQSGYHDEWCYCRMADHNCVEMRKSDARLKTATMIASGILSPTWATDIHTTNSAPIVKLESIEDIEARLSVCACGHVATTHDQDALGNLLSCSVKHCNCDHFRSVPKEKVAA